jgi:hypothetical protein
MFTLNRLSFSQDGVFGLMISDQGDTYRVLEHAFLQPDGSYKPKVMVGTYTCQRHAPNKFPYETFELVDVPPFMGEPVTGILIHIGNFDKDSDGCLLIGIGQEANMITESKIAFDKFMASLAGVEHFQLTIR